MKLSQMWGDKCETLSEFSSQQIPHDAVGDLRVSDHTGVIQGASM